MNINLYCLTIIDDPHAAWCEPEQYFSTAKTEEEAKEDLFNQYIKANEDPDEDEEVPENFEELIDYHDQVYFTNGTLSIEL